jgi:hypothetical protein
MILGMNAGLEYPDGSDANTNTKMWLHHVCFSLYFNALVVANGVNRW